MERMHLDGLDSSVQDYYFNKALLLFYSHFISRNYAWHSWISQTNCSDVCALTREILFFYDLSTKKNIEKIVFFSRSFKYLVHGTHEIIMKCYGNCDFISNCRPRRVCTNRCFVFRWMAMWRKHSYGH